MLARIRFASFVAACTVISTSLLGCVQQPVMRIGPFPAEQYQDISLDGNSTVVGQLFMRTLSGDVKYGAGSRVYLMPVTDYSRRLEAANARGARVPDYDPRVEQFSRIVQADGEGRFTFKKVAAGNYLVGGQVMWYRPSGFGPLPEGGFIMKEVTVAEGQEATVMVTR